MLNNTVVNVLVHVGLVLLELSKCFQGMCHRASFMTYAIWVYKTKRKKLIYEVKGLN